MKKFFKNHWVEMLIVLGMMGYGYIEYLVSEPGRTNIVIDNECTIHISVSKSFQDDVSFNLKDKDVAYYFSYDPGEVSERNPTIEVYRLVDGVTTKFRAKRNPGLLEPVVAKFQQCMTK